MSLRARDFGFIAFGAIALLSSVNADGRETPLRNSRHRSYIAARKRLIQDGWRPVGGPCDGVGDETCRRFPEIMACSGVSPGYCAMLFSRGGHCLSIRTLEGEPGQGDAKGTWINAIQDHQGRCVKS